MVGRPIKLNDEIMEHICENLRLGLSYSIVCKASGIHYDTFNEWIKKGREGKEEIYVDFLEKVEAAEIECAQESMRCIKSYAKTTYQAACWYMEHRFSQDFSKVNKLDVNAAHSGKVQIVLRQEDCGEDE